MFEGGCLAGDNNFPKATIDIELSEIINGFKAGKGAWRWNQIFQNGRVAMGYAATAAVILTEAEENGSGTAKEVNWDRMYYETIEPSRENF